VELHALSTRVTIAMNTEYAARRICKKLPSAMPNTTRRRSDLAEDGSMQLGNLPGPNDKAFPA
jgi:hypothetical protein